MWDSGVWHEWEGIRGMYKFNRNPIIIYTGGLHYIDLLTP